MNSFTVDAAPAKPSQLRTTIQCVDEQNTSGAWSNETQHELKSLVRTDFPGTWSEREDLLNDCIARRVLFDLKRVYAREQEASVPTTLASFTVDQRGPDGGRGLHVIKKFVEGEDAIWVNEEWPVRFDHLELPDEIRVRTRVFRNHSNARDSIGAEEDFISMRVRVAWNKDAKPQLFIENLFNEKSGRLVRRAPISNVTCQACHSSPSPFAERFRFPDQALHHDAIVQPQWFAIPLVRSIGFFDLMEIWPSFSKNRDRGSVQNSLSKIFESAETLRIPFTDIMTALTTSRLPRLPADRYLGSAHAPGDGVYAHRSSQGTQFYEDAISRYEREVLGRESTWTLTTHATKLP